MGEVHDIAVGDDADKMLLVVDDWDCTESIVVEEICCFFKWCAWLEDDEVFDHDVSEACCIVCLEEFSDVDDAEEFSVVVNDVEVHDDHFIFGKFRIVVLCLSYGHVRWDGDVADGAKVDDFFFMEFDDCLDFLCSLRIHEFDDGFDFVPGEDTKDVCGLSRCHLIDECGDVFFV